MSLACENRKRRPASLVGNEGRPGEDAGDGEIARARAAGQQMYPALPLAEVQPVLELLEQLGVLWILPAYGRRVGGPGPNVVGSKSASVVSRKLHHLLMMPAVAYAVALLSADHVPSRVLSVVGVPDGAGAGKAFSGVTDGGHADDDEHRGDDEREEDQDADEQRIHHLKISSKELAVHVTNRISPQ